MARTLNPSQLAELDYQRLGIPEPFRSTLGDIAPGAQGLIYGEPGSGKTTFATGIAAMLAQFGPVLYASPEEGFGPTVVDRIKRLGLDRAEYGNLHFAEVHNPAQLTEAIAEIRPFSIVLDSVTALDPTSEAARELSAWCREHGVGLWMIAHVTKSGRYRGGSAVAHDPDMVLRVTGGVVEPGKNRYGGAEPMEVAFTAAQLRKQLKGIRRENPNCSTRPQSAQCKAIFASLHDSGRYKAEKAPASPSSKRSSSKKSASSKGSSSKGSSSKKRASSATKKARPKQARKSPPPTKTRAKTEREGRAPTGSDAAAQSAVLDQLNAIEARIAAL